MDSWLPFEWIAASRFLREGRLQTIFIMLGVAIGVVLSSQAHIVLLPPKEVARPLRDPGREAEAAVIQIPFQRVRSIDQWQAIMQQVARMPEVTAASPMASGSVLAVRGEATRAVTVMGVDAERYFKIIPLPDKIVAGTARLNAEDIIVGTEFASDLGVTVGDKLRILPNAGEGATLTITGIVDLGNKSVNQRNAYVAHRPDRAQLVRGRGHRAGDQHGDQRRGRQLDCD